MEEPIAIAKTKLAQKYQISLAMATAARFTSESVVCPTMKLSTKFTALMTI